MSLLDVYIDFIIVVVVEEYGLICVVVIVVFYVIVVVCLMYCLMKECDLFICLVGVGLVCVLGV